MFLDDIVSPLTVKEARKSGADKWRQHFDKETAASREQFNKSTEHYNRLKTDPEYREQQFQKWQQQVHGNKQINELFEPQIDYYTLSNGQMVQASYRPGPNLNALPGSVSIEFVDPKLKPRGGSFNSTGQASPWDRAPDGVKQEIMKFVKQQGQQQPAPVAPSQQVAQHQQQQGMAEGEADYGPKYQAMVKRVGQMAKEGPRKTVWDPVKRVYKTVPASSPKEQGVAEAIPLDTLRSTAGTRVKDEVSAKLKQNGPLGRDAEKAKQNGKPVKPGVAEGVDIGQEWMSDTELDQYVPDQLQQQWRELLGYDRNGNPSALWANLTGGYEPDVRDPQHRALMVKVANKWFAAKKIPNVKFFDVKDADDELEWLVQIGQQGVAEALGTSPDKLLARTGMNMAHKFPRKNQTNLGNIPGMNTPSASPETKAFADQQRARRSGDLKAAIRDQLGNHRKPNLPESDVTEGGPYDLPGKDYDRPGDTPRKQSGGEHNPYPYSPEEDNDYFQEIFRRKREAAAKAKAQGSSLNELSNDKLASYKKDATATIKQGDNDAKKHVKESYWTKLENERNTKIAKLVNELKESVK